MASNAENVSIWWRHHDSSSCHLLSFAELCLRALHRRTIPLGLLIANQVSISTCNNRHLEWNSFLCSHNFTLNNINALRNISKTVKINSTSIAKFNRLDNYIIIGLVTMYRVWINFEKNRTELTESYWFIEQNSFIIYGITEHWMRGPAIRHISFILTYGGLRADKRIFIMIQANAPLLL